MANRLSRYESYFETGLWHVHTRYTDGKNSVDEICKAASLRRIPLVGFTEHVRKELRYDFADLIRDIRNARQKYDNLTILAGCEAKVINHDGDLDVSQDVIDLCDFVMGVFHSFSCEDKQEYLATAIRMLERGTLDVWGHPTLFAAKNKWDISIIEFQGILSLCKKKDIYLEHNLRYQLPPRNLLEAARTHGIPIIDGHDLHDVGKL